ncbi:MAG: hypothetical protein FJ265_08075 [Planctomycetes bacterium]|nr:hypothetical protein [Planctomycetota bacterium]
MDALQFSLFFVALVVGYVLVHLRLVRCEEHLQKLAGIRALDDRLRTLDERLQQLAEAFAKVRLERVEARLDRLHEDLEDLREATQEVRHAVVQIPPPPPAPALEPPPPPVAAEPPGARIQALVEKRLLELGYGNLQILGDLGSVAGELDVEVQVEAERGNMPVKGRVVVRNGAVRDVAMQSVAQTFP